MDANLEEKNKDSKVWQHGGMTAIDWLRIFRNLGKLTNVSAGTKVIFLFMVEACVKMQTLPLFTTN